MTRSADPLLFLPYPELVEDAPPAHPYRIRDSSHEPGLGTDGALDRAGRRMWVPLREDGRPVRRHELGHGRFSPLVLPQVAFEIGVLAAVEDARVNLGIERAGLPQELDFESEARAILLAAGDAKRGDAFALFQRAVASIGTSVEPAMAHVLRRDDTPFGEAIRGWVARVDRTLRRAAGRRRLVAAPFATGLALARSLAAELRAQGILDAEGKARTRSVIRCCVSVGERDGKAWGLRTRPSADPDGGPAVGPGRLVVRTMPLPVTLRARSGGRVWRAASEGSVVRYVHRWATDRAIFRGHRREHGVTVLVDVSGSMSISAGDLDRFLAAAPTRTRIALYAGADDTGELRIVAENGQRAAIEDLGGFGSGNVVDLPALEWLARQRAPRIWVSDGGVTGVGDRPSTELAARCRALRRRARIHRVTTLEEACEAVVGGARRAPGLHVSR